MPADQLMLRFLHACRWISAGNRATAVDFYVSAFRTAAAIERI